MVPTTGLRDLIAGIGNVASGSEAVIWDAQQGLTGLGDLPGGDFLSSAYGINDAGVVVGTGRVDDGDQTFIWDPVNGMVALRDLIQDGSDDGFNMRQARDINNRGAIVGWGEHFDGKREAFLLVPVP